MSAVLQSSYYSTVHDEVRIIVYTSPKFELKRHVLSFFGKIANVLIY